MLRLKEIRTLCNLTQNELGAKIGIRGHNIGDWERGTSEPSIDWIIKLADALETTIDYLLGREDDFGNIVINKEARNGATSPVHTLEEERLLAAFNKLDSRTKSRIIEDCEYFATKTVKV